MSSIRFSGSSALSLDPSTQFTLWDLVRESIASVNDRLQTFAQRSDFADQISLAFGGSPAGLQQAWADGLVEMPKIEIRSQSELKGALGAFAASENTIYLSLEFLQNSDRSSLEAVVLEEYGHYLDALINAIDSPGDEGAIFSALLRRIDLSEKQFQALRQEDDSASLLLDGSLVQVEQEDSNIITILPLDADKREGNSGSTPFTFEVTRTGATNNFLTVSYEVVTGSPNSADAEDFVGNQISTVTSSNQGIIPSTGQTLNVSLSLPDSSVETSITATGFVSRSDVNPPINVAYVIDVSGSTVSTPFEGTVSVGDLNGDGNADTVIDAAIAAFESLNQAIIDLNLGSAVSVGLIPFAATSRIMTIVTPDSDSNSDGQTDISKLLRGINQEGISTGDINLGNGTILEGGTNFEEALKQTINFFNAVPNGDNFVFFLSDGEDNRGGASAFANEVSTLLDANGLNAELRPLGVGSAASLTQLDFVDDGIDNNSAQAVLNPDALTPQLTSSPIESAQVDRVEIYRDGTLLTTVAGADLIDTPLGLQYTVTLDGLNPTADNTIEVRVIATDPAATTVATSQVVEAIESEQNLPTGTLSFTPGETTKVLTINVSGDRDSEPDENFNVVVTDPTGFTDTASGLIANDDGDDFILTTKDEIYEYLAKDIVYKDWNIQDPLNFNGLNYTVDAIWENKDTKGKGFYALGLTSNNPLTLSPVLAFRGTEPTAEFFADIIADLYISDVGFNQFENGLSLTSDTVSGDSITIADWVNEQNSPTLLGHSLGGALTQLFAADFTSKGSSLGDVYTFNSPGISRSRADRFDASKVQEVKHNIVSGDLVSLAGEDYIQGEWELFKQPLKEGENGLKQGIIDIISGAHHLNPIFAPEVGYDSDQDDPEKKRPENLTSSEFSSIDNLANLFFTYPTLEYFTTLLAAAGLSSIFLPAPVSASLVSTLLFRVTVETARKAIGTLVLAIGEAVDAGVDFLSNIDLNGTIQFPDIDLALINLSDLQVSLDTNEGRLIAQGEIIAGPSVDIQLPSWAGGTITTPDIIKLIATGGFTDFGQLEGDAQIFVLGSVGQGNGEFTIDFNDRTLITSGNLSILNDFVKADITLAPTANFDFVTSGNATINFPDIGFSIEIPEVSLPFGVTIPGTSKQINLTNAYSGSYQLVFTNDDNLSNDYVWGGARVNPIPGIDFYLGLQVFFNAEFKKTDAPPILPEVGSFEVSENTPWIVLNAVWENSNSEVAVEIIAPDGTIFTEDTWDTDRFAIVEDFTTDTSRSVGILNPEPGIWDIRAVDETGLGVVDYSGFRNSETPTLAITDVVANNTGSEVTITYDALDADSDATLSFFYDADNQGFDGILIETNITEADGTSTYTWDTQGVAPGSYYIYASAFDGNNAPVQTYSVGTVEITEATATDVSVDKVASADTLEPGAALTYTITITNTGDIEAVGVSLTETLPEGATLVSTSLTPNNQSENVLTFDLGNLASGASTIIDVTIAAPETVIESRFISSRSQISSLTFDTNFNNDFAIVATTLNTDPTLDDIEKIVLEDETLTFEATDFTNVFDDDDEDNLQSIQIAALLL